MVREWYVTRVVYGYEIKVPDDTTYRSFVRKLDGLNSILKEPFYITGILNRFYSNLEYSTTEELRETDKKAKIVLGFDPDTKMAERIAELAEYIVDNPILVGLDISQTAEFYSGIDWFCDILDEESDSDEGSEEDLDEDSDEDLDDSSDEDLDEDLNVESVDSDEDD